MRLKALSVVLYRGFAVTSPTGHRRLRGHEGPTALCTIITWSAAYNCGGVEHAMTEQGFGPIGKWLRPLKELYLVHKNQIESATDAQFRWDRFAEINVTKQYRLLPRQILCSGLGSIKRAPIAWLDLQLRTGYLNELIRAQPESTLKNIERHA